MKTLFTMFVLIVLLSACGNRGGVEHTVNSTTSYLHAIPAFTTDSLVNVVIEIPAGTNQKWELNKETGRIEWERVTPDSLRIIDYLAYPANYGFVPQTLLPEITGGDGDPVDVFVLGPSMARETIVSVRIIGIIHMNDDKESDSKLLAVDAKNPVFNVNSYELLVKEYPGVLDIITLWLLNYKGTGRIEILSVQDEKQAIRYLKDAHNHYSNLKHEK
jgi:inorganic pyrophosphatase